MRFHTTAGQGSSQVMVTVSSTKTPPSPLLLSELDERIIRAAGMYKYVTIEDLYHLLGPISYSTLRERARRLAGNADHVAGQYLFRFPLPSPAKGTHARVYTLGVKGRQFLGQEGFYRPSKFLSMSYSSLWHALTLTRCCVCASLLHPAFTLTELQLSYGLAVHPPRVTLDRQGEKKAVAVIPDAVLWFVRSDGEELCVLLEVDRGTTGSRRIKEALQARIELLKGGLWQRFFGIGAVRIAYLTTAGEARRDALELWTYDVCAKVIEEKHRQGWLEKFYFSAMEYDELIDNALWTDPLWYCPASETPVSLLPKGAGNQSEHAGYTTNEKEAMNGNTDEETAVALRETGASSGE